MTDSTTLKTIVNSTTISNEDTAITADGRLSVTNSGYIKGDTDGNGVGLAIDTSHVTANDTIVNAGYIIGDIHLGGGDDSLINSASIKGRIDMGAGNDKIDAGGWSLTIVASEGADTIRYFDAGAGSMDVLDLSNFSQFTDFEAVKAATTMNGWNSVIDLGNGNSVTLSNVQSSWLHADDFLYAEPASGLHLIGTDADETLVGAEGDDTIEGLGGDDDLIGHDGHDILLGGDGNDYFVGGRGNDSIDSGSGSYNWIDYKSEDNTQGITVDLTAGTAIDGYGDTDTLTGNFYWITGTRFNDQILGSSQSDNDEVFDGGAGDDHHVGYGGNDAFLGGEGSDFFDGGEGQDTVYYSSWHYDGNQTQGVFVDLATGTATDAVGDTDTFVSIESAAGSDWDDILNGDDGRNRLTGRSGDDIIDGRGGDDFMRGDEGADTFIYRDGAGHDWIADFTLGTDKVDLTGVTLFDKNGNGIIDIEDLELQESNGTDTRIVFENGSLQLQNVAFGTISDSDFIMPDPAAGEHIIGTDGDDNLEGNLGNDTIEGLAGQDVLYGNLGDDILLGGTGNDDLLGGKGSDILDGGAGRDVAHYGQGQINGVHADLALGTATDGDGSVDTLIDIESVFGSHVDDTLLGDEQSNEFRGNAGNDIIKARGGSDWIHGGEGADLIEGGEGIDFLQGGDGFDSLYGGADADDLFGGAGEDLLDGGEGHDTANFSTHQHQNPSQGVLVNLAEGTAIDSEGWLDTLVSIESVIGTKFYDVLQGDDGANSLFGNGGDDELYGRGGNDHLEGRDGNDQIYGGDGDDQLNGDKGDDFLDGGAGQDNFFAGSGNDRMDGGDGEDYVFFDHWQFDAPSQGVFVDLANGTAIDAEGYTDTLSNIEHIRGSDLDDTLQGDATDNDIMGMSGNDIIAGREGNDTMHGGEGADTFLYSAGDGHDNINDFTIGEDKLDLSNAGITDGNGDGVIDINDLTFIDNDGHTYISIEQDGIFLSNVAVSDLTNDDFIF